MSNMSALVEDPNGNALNSSPEILSDQQIEELLQEAETRLRAKAGLDLKPQDSEEILSLGSALPAPSKKIHFPKLEHNLDRSSYIKTHNGVAKAAPNLIVPATQREMADGLRAVSRWNGENKKMVSYFPSLPFSSMRKSYPNFLLMHISTSF